MFIHPDGSVTGSVNHAVLDAYNDAKARGGDLSEFAPFLAENSSEAQLAQGAAVSRTEPSVEAKAADERAAAAAKAVQESSDQRSADLAAQAAQSQPVEPPGVFDPGQHTVAEVNEYLASASPEEASRVLDAELAGKARSTLLGPRDEE